ncbi:hypothetical protein [Cohaesibacter celericrescens]|uniref:Uncharacterized protein n=1 Tax=Cohaesibacter celericrescens TaxID=2067669 RepID=A0A2N5XX68_9HYPH|nr:hypothetical protein [Cohaesibacter celericrescens]PLW79100.1 hypothetical protein C0081_02390 [Cohaesibacter celericrescens]
MTPCTLSFPCSIGDRVFSQRLGKAGNVIGLQKCENCGPKAFIEYLNNDGEPKTLWAFCDTLRAPINKEERETEQ